MSLLFGCLLILVSVSNIAVAIMMAKFAREEGSRLIMAVSLIYLMFGVIDGGIALDLAGLQERSVPMEVTEKEFEPDHTENSGFGGGSIIKVSAQWKVTCQNLEQDISVVFRISASEGNSLDHGATCNVTYGVSRFTKRHIPIRYNGELLESFKRL